MELHHSPPFTAFTPLNAGSCSFTDPYYRDFGFLDYLAYVLNAVSEQLQVETNFEGHRYELTCKQGEIIHNLREVAIAKVENKGTKLTVIPDRALFPNFKFEFDELYKRLRELKNEFSSINITLEDKRSNQKVDIAT